MITQAQLAKLVGAMLLVFTLIGIGFAGAWAWQKNKFTAQLDKQALAFKTDLDAINAQGVAQTRAAVELQQKAQLALANLDQHSFQEKADALAENERLRHFYTSTQDDNAHLRSSVVIGKRRLRIAGRCTFPGDGASNVRPPTGAASMDDGGTVELSAATGSAVFNIRASITSDQVALIGLQRYVREQCFGR